MKVAKTLLVVILSLMVLACLDQLDESNPPVQCPPPPAEGFVEKEQLSLTLKTNKNRYAPNEIAEITASLSNNSDKDVVLIASCPGAPVIGLQIFNDIAGVISLYDKNSGGGCPAVIDFITLAPGETISRTFNWSVALENNIPIPNGNYSVQAQVTINNEIYDSIDIAIRIEIAGSETFIDKFTAFSTAFQQSTIKDWYTANQYDNKCYLSATNEVTFDAEWNVSINKINVSEESTATIPACNIRLLEGPLWRVNLYNKFGLSPGEYEVKIDAISGTVISTEML